MFVKCVYKYEDKYSFARILPPDSLVFDSHFESGNLSSAFRKYRHYKKDCPAPYHTPHEYDL